MRKAHLSVAAVAALVTFVAGSAITAQPRRAPSTAPLFPLSERDLTATRESGCECGFRVGRNTLVQMIGDELTIRTRAGRQVCPISDNQFSALSNGRGSAACAGLRLSLRPTGRVTTHMESDSAEGPAALTVSQGRVRRTLVGRWGCAC
jgi:hypothetical protein